MLVQDILWSARFDYLDDAVNARTAAEWSQDTNSQADCLWPDELLLRHLNTVLNEWCRETGCLRDWTTPSICQIPILCNQYLYSMSPLITEIHNGYLDHGAPLVLPKSDTWLDENVPYWRRIATSDPTTFPGSFGSVKWLLPDYGQNFLRTIYYPNPSLGYWRGAFTFTGLGGTIAHTITTGEPVLSTVLKAADQVVISGTINNGTLAVPKTFTVTSVSSTGFTVSEAVTDEIVASGGIVQKVIDTLRLTVSRLPLLPLTIANIATQSPEIRADYHPDLIDGICREAYKKQDSQCLDVGKSEEHRKAFEYSKNQAKNQRDNLRRTTQTMKPHPGAI